MNTLSGLEFFSYILFPAIFSAIFIRWLIQKNFITQKMILNFCILILVYTFSYLIYSLFKLNLLNYVASFEFMFFLGPPIILIFILFLSKMNLLNIEKFYLKHIISFFLLLIFLINLNVYYNNKKVLDISNKYSIIKENFKKNGKISESEISELRKFCDLSGERYCPRTIINAIVSDNKDSPYYNKYINRNLDELIRLSENKIQNYIIIRRYTH